MWFGFVANPVEDELAVLIATVAVIGGSVIFGAVALDHGRPEGLRLVFGVISLAISAFIVPVLNMSSVEDIPSGAWLLPILILAWICCSGLTRANWERFLTEDFLEFFRL